MASLPSPASSPSLTPSDTTAQPSRKRQRSRSMQSDTSSSSVKRSISEGNSLESARSPTFDQLSNLTLADSSRDIDAYMAEQGEDEIQPTLSLLPPAEGATQQPLSSSERWALVDKERNVQMQPGETWYLISKSWWRRWARACGGLVDKEVPVLESQVGPVDNSPLLDSSGTLLPGLVEGVEVEYVPAVVWDRFNAWYGPSSQSLPRRVIERGTFVKMSVLELHPPQIRVMRLTRETPAKAMGSPCLSIEISMGDTVKDLCTKVAEAVKTEPAVATPYRVWKPANPPERWEYANFPVVSLAGADAKVIDESSQTLSNQNIETGDLFIVEFKQSDGWVVENEATQKPAATVEGPPPLFSSKDNFFNRFATSSSTTTAVTTTKTPNFVTGMGSKSPSTFSIAKSYTKTLEPGTLGLGNMGNTCFMNSALQCLTHTQELAEYFLNGIFKAELNRDNPLGMQGAIAEVFGALMERVWATSGPSASYSPREFKQTLQKFAPQFSGYQQHDSQELVAFLLDGLHEDLNRVIKKPFVEKPDWEGGGDAELVKLAIKSWEGYMLRNDSVIVDLFQGQYQSTLVCPECSKISITFDPFMYLTLPLPVQKTWKHIIYYVPWDLEKPHTKVPIEINRDSSFKDLRVLLGRWVDAIPENLLMLEIFHNKFYKLLDDGVAVGDMSDSDTIVCFELPCNARLNRTYKKQGDDPFIMPLLLCDAKPMARSFGNYRSNTSSLFGYPAIVVIDKKDATCVEAIYDSVVDRLKRWTNNARDLYDWEVPSGSAEPVSIPISGFSPVESVTEFIPDGDVVTVEAPEEEVDIADEKHMLVDEAKVDTPPEPIPRPYRTKKDVFNLKIYTNQKDYGTNCNYYPKVDEWATWDERARETSAHGLLLREWDSLYAEFDENMKAYFFGESRTFENSCWDQWEEFIHPDLASNKKSESARKKRGITLEDCLEEFVKEEQLGEDDLWYCPRCKKHQQATKKFDLWKAPDVLVVHLKRFSNNRLLRDKIDTLVDFPLEGLELSDKVGERQAAKRLKEEGVDLEELKQINLDEPLLYDLFAVDEHMGGLGGGHYRAYAANHLTKKWYHFDDGYVSEAKAEASVNSNAYLLFYRRRSSKPLGGDTYQRAMQKQPEPESTTDSDVAIDETQLPTPPYEGDGPFVGPSDRLSPSSSTLPFADYWTNSDPVSSGSSPPTDDPADFEDATSELAPGAYDPYQTYENRMGLSNYRKSSPSSSNEAEADMGDGDDRYWDSLLGSAENSSEWGKESLSASPSHSELSEHLNPFDQNLQDEVELEDNDLNT